MSGTSRECRHEETGHIQGIEKAAQQILKKKKNKKQKKTNAMVASSQDVSMGKCSALVLPQPHQNYN